MFDDIALLFGTFGVFYSLYLKYIKKSNHLHWSTWSVFGTFFMTASTIANKDDWVGWTYLWSFLFIWDLVDYNYAKNASTSDKITK